MMTEKRYGQWKRRTGTGILTVLLMLLSVVCFQTLVQAASGSVYSCTINRSYSHPVTGEIEDAGGAASTATGQGMVEGAVYGSGMLEVTTDGACYLTFRLSLIDYISNQTFAVQNVGDSGWSQVTPSVTASGTDSNGTTSDLCIQVPSENCIVRGSMYITPMGRDVIFYFYPGDYTEGNSVGMTATIVTESAESAQGENSQNDISADETSQTTVSETPEATELPAATQAPASAEADTAEQQENSSTETADPQADADTELSSAQGLSLSTASEATEVEDKDNANGGMGSLILALTVSITLSGLILMGAAAWLVYYFRRNWRRWGDDDEDYDYGDEEDTWHE